MKIGFPILELLNKFVFVSLLLFGLALNAQLQVANWYFGNKAGLNFNVPDGEMPNVLFDGALRTIEGCSSISDENGNLLFYTDGIYVYNRNHLKINNNNTKLFGDPSSSQSGIIVPNPANNGIYYIFTVDANDDYPQPDSEDGPLKGFRFSELNINLNGGLGGITSYNNSLVLDASRPNISSEKVTAVRHFNQQDVWVITHLGNKFYSFLVTPSGVNTTPVVTTIEPFINPEGIVVNARGYMKASPNGKYVAIAHYSNITTFNSTTNNTGANNVAPGILALYDFNNQTGTLSNYRNLDSTGTPYGVEFSPNSKFLYAEIDYNDQTSFSWTSGRLTQWNLENLSSIDIVNINTSSDLNSWPQVSSLSRFRGALQLGIDGRIYYSKTSFFNNFNSLDIVSAYRGSTLSVIQKPNLEGTACNFQVNSFVITNPSGANASTDTQGTNHYVAYGLPPFITSYFNNDIEINVENVCEGEEAVFTLDIDPSVSNITNIVWDMGDGTTYNNQTSVTHVYALPGTYVIEVKIFIGNDGLSIPASREITVYPKPSVQNATLVQCDGANIDGKAAFNLNLANDEILVNPNGNSSSIAYYLTQEDAENQVNPLSIPFTNISNPQTIYARVENNYPCFKIAELELSVVNNLFDLGSWEVCDDPTNDGKEVFNLADLESQIYAQASGSSYAFYNTQGDSENDINRITNINSYTNQTNPEYIYIRVFNGDDCTGLGRVQLVVRQKPVIISSFQDVEVCRGTPVVLNPGTFDRYLWSDGSTTSTLNVTESGTYTVQVWLDYDDVSCTDTKTVQVIINENPEVQDSELIQCEDNVIDGFASFRLSDANNEIVVNGNAGSFQVSYYLTATDAQNQNNPLPNNYTNISNPQTIFARIQNNNGCLSYAELELSVIYEEFEVEDPLYLCDDESNDGVEPFNLTTLDADLLSTYGGTTIKYYLTEEDAQKDENPIVNPSSFPNQVNPQTIFIRVLNGVDCAALGSVKLIVQASPVLEIEDAKICPGAEFTFDAGPGYVRYLWSTGSTAQKITVSEEGTYSVTVWNESDCSTTEEMQLIIVQPVILDIKIVNNTIEIIAEGEQPLEYSIDLENWQTSNVFTGVPFGIYTAYVRDAFGCVSKAKLFSIIALPNIITPNGDGKNDGWNVKGLTVYPGTIIEIYDRYGKKLHTNVIPKLYPDGEVPITQILNDKTPYIAWDGKYLGRAVPSTSYWYIVKIPDGRQFSGYLVVKNRNSDWE